MSGRAPQRAPKDAPPIRTESEAEDRQIFEWMAVGNGFPFHIPVVDDEGDLRISRDGRTLYGDRFLVRVGRESYHSPIRRWDYQVDRSGTELSRKRFAYPIVRSLWDYAPGVAARIGLEPRIRTISVDITPQIRRLS